ncbi:MAG: MaoC family dehydratase N-terminal domain-containing protein, partial [Dehalococcoidia bacterium]|nr:MaoC family dehydratase N-terminal domain-containing protein [Dehalococcoidia bacterium]
QGLPGVHGFHGGNDWEFYKPVRENDEITPELVFTGFREKRSYFAGRSVMEYQEASYQNQRGELVAKASTWIVRAERQAARETGKYHQIELPHPWKEEELTAIEDQVLAEEIRGSTPRYWEDIEVGDPLGPVIKGPLGLTDMIAYCVGAAPIQVMAHHASLQLYRKHPAWAFRDPDTYALEPVYSVHYLKTAANAAGLPYPYDVGVQRHSWLINMLTNWMGDDGWIKKNHGEYRRFVYLSDCVWLTGRVTKKYVDADGEYVVDVRTESMNQRGEDVMPGWSTICLPSKTGYNPLDRRLER